RLTSAGIVDVVNFGNAGKTIIPFNKGGFNSDGATAVTTTGTQIIVAGYAQVGVTNFDMAATALDQGNGHVDLNFGPNGDGTSTVGFDLGGSKVDRANAIALQGTSILLAGSAQGTGGDADFAFARLLANGHIDLTFGPNLDGKSTVSFNQIGNTADA